MNSSGLSIVTAVGLWILGITIFLAIIMMWHDVSQKLNYILVRLEKAGREKEGTLIAGHNLPKRDINTALGNTLSPIVSVCIIGAAILFFVIIPIFLRSRQ